MSKQSNNVELPAIIMLAPEDGVLPDGFPLRATSVYGTVDAIREFSKLLEKRDQNNIEGGAQPEVALWTTTSKSIQAVRTIGKMLDGVIFKTLLNIPEADYSSVWMIHTSDLATYDVEQITAHVNMADPAAQVESKITPEAQERKFDEHMDDIMKSLDVADDGSTSGLGLAGADDTLGGVEEDDD